MSKLFTFFLLIFNLNLIAQPVTNLDKINNLLHSVCKDVSSVTPSKLYLNFNAPGSLYFLKNRTELFFTENEKELTESSLDTLNFNIEDANIVYSEMFKDGFFGDYFIVRVANLKGTYVLKEKNNVKIAKEFIVTSKDTINYDDINKVENLSLPFTRSKLPTGPVLPTIIEALIAIASSVVTVLLFFTVRSR